MNLDLFERYGRWLTRHRTGLLALILVLTVAAVFAINERVKDGAPVDFTPQAMFMGDGDEWKRLQSYEAEFGVEDNTMVILVEGPVNSSEGLDFLQKLHDAIAKQDQVESVDSVLNAAIAVSGDDGMITIIDAVSDDPSPLLRATRDPFLSPLLVAPDASAATLRVQLDDRLQAIADLSPVVQRVTETTRSIAPPDGYTVHITGIPFVRAEVVDLMIADEMVFFPLVTLMFLITIVALFRRLWLGLVPLIGVLIATTWTMGVLLASGAVLNILSVLTPTLVLVIGVADGIHLVSRYQEELAKKRDPEGAMGTTLRHMTVACFLTTFTTAAGFASLLIADTKVIRDFGSQASIAVMITFFAVVVVVPTLLAWLPVERVGRPRGTLKHPFYLKLSQLVIGRPRTIIAVTLTLTLLAGWAGRGVSTDSGLLEMYRPGHPTWSAVQTAEEKVGGVIPIFIHLEGESGQMMEPEVLKKVAALETVLQGFDLTGATVSPAGWVQHFHTLLTGQNGWPESREAVAQELLLAEMAGDLPITKVLSADAGRARILAITKDAGGREFLAAKHILESEASRIFAGTGIDVDVTGDGMLASHGVDQLIRDLLSSLLLMLGVIVLTLFILLRNIRLTLIATLPNLVPLVFILGALGVLGADLQTSNIVSFTVAVGLAVDDTIHFIVRYREERRSGLDTALAITNTFNGAGHAIVLTSILLISGFGILAFSPLNSTHFFGTLACVTMAAALIGDLLILPAMLRLFDKA